jgi:hypothetical protein
VNSQRFWKAHEDSFVSPSSSLLAQIRTIHSHTIDSLRSIGWVFRSHLEDEAEELLTREQEDLDQAETDKWKEISRGTNGRKYAYSEYDDKVPKEGTGKRVTKYVEKRKKIVKAFEEVSQICSLSVVVD